MYFEMDMVSEEGSSAGTEPTVYALIFMGFIHISWVFTDFSFLKLQLLSIVLYIYIVIQIGVQTFADDCWWQKSKY